MNDPLSISGRRIEQNGAGVYRIAPAPAAPPVDPTRSADQKPSNSPPETDRVDIASINLDEARERLPEDEKIKARLRSLTGGRVNQPIDFGPPRPNGRNALLDRTYFQRTADRAALNAAAVEKHLDTTA